MSFTALCMSQKRFGAARCRSSGTRWPSERYATAKPARIASDSTPPSAAASSSFVMISDSGFAELEHAQRLGEAAAIGAGREHEHGLDAVTLDAQRRELIREPHVALAHAGRVDQHELLARKPSRMRRSSSDVSATCSGARRMRAKLKSCWRAPMRYVSVLTRPSSSTLWRSTKRAAIFAIVVVLPTPVGPTTAKMPPRSAMSHGASGSALAEQAHERAQRLLSAEVGRDLVRELLRERRVDAELRHLAQQPGAHRRVTVQVVPREARELRLEQAAQVLDLVGDAAAGGHRGLSRRGAERGRTSRDARDIS